MATVGMQGWWAPAGTNTASENIEREMIAAGLDSKPPGQGGEPHEPVDEVTTL